MLRATAILGLLSLYFLLASAINFDVSGKSDQVSIGDDDETYTVPGKNPLNFCADPRDYLLTIDHVDLKPNPPAAGTTLTISATGNVSSTITKGAHALISVKLQLNYGGQIPILQRDEDLCDLLERDDDIKQKCPIDKDKEIKIEKSVDIPGRVPKGKFVVLIDALTEAKEKITCLTTEIQF